MHAGTVRRALWHVGLAVVSLALCGCAARGRSVLAIPDRFEDYEGRYMGGGAHFGETRGADEGTWSRDYAGLDPMHMVELRWSHSRAFHQGGRGCY